jgi:adenylate cyclase
MAEERVQRRLAAILAADVVGYSRMMREDEADTLARLKTIRREVLDPKVDEYGGRIFKTMGDGFLVEFPSAVDAVQNAIDVQRAIRHQNSSTPENRRIEFRIGINVGDIIVDGEDVYGDGVNIASRIEALADSGSICISSFVHDQVRHKLALQYDDLGEQLLKNIADPVHVYGVNISEAQGSQDVIASSDAVFRRPAVAVLPLVNLSGDPEQEFFADGLTEDIITALSLWRSFPVIARNSTFAYKGTSPDIRRLGEELGARYVVEGSVRKAGIKLRVAFQLVNTANGHHVLAEKFDRDVDDIFALQDEISSQIAGAIAPEIDRAKQQRPQAAKPANLDAWEYFQRGMSLFDKLSKDTNRTAREMYLKAIELDPSYCAAHAELALTYHMDLRLEFSEDREKTLSKLLKAAEKAVALDDSNWSAHYVSSLAAIWAGEHARSLSEGRKSVELNPSGIDANVSYGAALDFAGQPAEAIPFCERALQLSPRHPRRVMFQAMLARAQLNAGSPQAAADTARKAIEIRSDLVEPRLILASALAHMDKLSEAKETFQAVKQINVGEIEPPASWNRYAEPSNRDYLLEGLRKAGWEG